MRWLSIRRTDGLDEEDREQGEEQSPLAPKTVRFSKSFKWLAKEYGTPGAG